MPVTVPTVAAGLKRILVATDFTAASTKAVEHAIPLARSCGAELYLTHVVSSLGFTLAGPETVTAAADIAAHDLQEIEDGLVRNGELANVTHRTVVCQGNVGEELERIVEREHIDLIVVGSHGHRGLGKVASVAEEIFRHVSCPVLTIGPRVN